MAMTPVSPGTGAGEGFVPPTVPLPSSPTLLSPHVQTEPSFLRATLWPAPALTALMPVSVVRCTGISCVPPVVPSPSCPVVLSPQLHTVPSVLTARLCAPPAETALPWERPLTVPCTLAVVGVPL